MTEQKISIIMHKIQDPIIENYFFAAKEVGWRYLYLEEVEDFEKLYWDESYSNDTKFEEFMHMAYPNEYSKIRGW